LLYDWSRDPGLDTGAGHLAVALCADVIAATHPAEALVRLHHLVRRNAGDVRAEAEEALWRLVHQDRREFRRLLDRVGSSLAEEPPAGDGQAAQRRAADLDLFLALARPAELARPSGSLLADSVVRWRLVPGWQALLSEGPSTAWAALAWEWLGAGESDRLADLWLDTLARACARPGVGSGRLYVVARDWARERGADRQARGRVALDLANRMDRAQGITPAAGPRHRSEESSR
jgi:hypothetical protein